MNDCQIYRFYLQNTSKNTETPQSIYQPPPFFFHFPPFLGKVISSPSRFPTLES